MGAPSPAPGWYPDPAGTLRQRYFDGRNWTENYAPLPQGAGRPPAGRPGGWPTWATIVLVVGGVFLLIIIIGVAGSSSDNDSDTASTSTSRAPSSAASPPAAPGTSTEAAVEPEPPPAGIGTEVRDGKFAFVVTSIDTSAVAGDPSNPFMRVEPQGVFVNVHMAVTNIGNEPQTFFADNQKLFIGEREYSPDTMAAVWTKSTNVEINPGNTIQAVVSFDVPANPPPVVSSVELHDSMFSGGVTVYP